MFWNHDYRLVFGGMYLSMEDIGNTDKILGIIGEDPLPLPPGIVADTVVSLIESKGAIVILLGGIHRFPCIFKVSHRTLTYQ